MIVPPSATNVFRLSTPLSPMRAVFRAMFGRLARQRSARVLIREDDRVESPERRRADSALCTVVTESRIAKDHRVQPRRCCRSTVAETNRGGLTATSPKAGPSVGSAAAMVRPGRGS
jgi:hypothetical protein